MSDYLSRIESLWPHEWGVSANTLFATLIGSMAHGTQMPKSDPNAVDDVDFMMVVVPPKEWHLGLRRFDHWTPPIAEELDITCYGLQKFTGLLLKGNPNVIGLLWMPAKCVLLEGELWGEWIDNRDAFMSQRVLSSFSGYAYDQLQRLGRPNSGGYMGKERKGLFEKYGFDPKNASHCLRLLRMGAELAETGQLNVDRTEIDAEELMSIKRGEWTLGEVKRAADRGFARLEDASTQLPEEPNFEVAERLLIDTTLRYWERN